MKKLPDTLLATAALLLLCLALAAQAQEPLPGTEPLQLAPGTDLSQTLISEIRQDLLQRTEAVAKERAAHWPGSQQEHRQHLRDMLGCMEHSPAPKLQRSTTEGHWQEIRWPVLEGLQWEGTELPPPQQQPCIGTLIYLPHEGSAWPPPHLRSMTQQGLRIIIPHVISRSRHSSATALGKTTGIPHREWLYRQTFTQGKHPLGYEITALQALVTAVKAAEPSLPIHCAGHGEGGHLALLFSALDERIAGSAVSGSFSPRENMWKEPLDRNLWAFLKEFSHAEIATLLAPRSLYVVEDFFPAIPPTHANAQGRQLAAPVQTLSPPLAECRREFDRAKQLCPGDWLQRSSSLDEAVRTQLSLLATAPALAQEAPDDSQREHRLMQQLCSLAQQQLAKGEQHRQASFWDAMPKQKEAFSAWQQQQRQHFQNHVIGHLSVQLLPPVAHTRRVRETPRATLYELLIEAWPGVHTWAWLALPKDLTPGQQRPLIVCQHGLDGLPEHCYETDTSTRAWQAYKAWALQLTEQHGYITLAPHNCYRGGDAFRSLQRIAQPLGLSLFSYFIPQHQALLNWVKTQPWCDAQHIAFYGLSYGGKSAMRIPALLPDYCLSICSGDFNEWVRKCCSTDMRMSYVFTPEYEIWEWNLGSTFNYAEMAALIYPRPFMVERGHRDGVGTDSWVNYEYAKVRQFYDEQGLGQLTEIEHFNGPHTIHGQGSFHFLKKYLGR